MNDLLGVVLVQGVEAATPDLRLELGPRDPLLLLSWPVAPISFPLIASCRAGMFAVPFVEPQLRPSDSAARVLLGMRFPLATSLPVGALVEGAGVLGTDGNGWSIGTGLALWLEASGNAQRYVALVGRMTDAPHEIRYDVSLDVSISVFSSSARRLLAGSPDTKRLCRGPSQLPQPISDPPIDPEVLRRSALDERRRAVDALLDARRPRSVRMTAVRMLAQLDGQREALEPDVLDALVSLLGASDGVDPPFEDLSTVQALVEGMLGVDAWLDRLAAMVRDASEPTRRVAARCLRHGRLPALRATSLLTQLAGDPDEAVREMAEASLVEVCRRALLRASERGLEAPQACTAPTATQSPARHE